MRSWSKVLDTKSEKLDQKAGGRNQIKEHGSKSLNNKFGLGARVRRSSKVLGTKWSKKLEQRSRARSWSRKLEQKSCLDGLELGSGARCSALSWSSKMLEQ